ncbi:M48 family metallopeptidase [Patescibacteria group bacterium]|nr:M48 family metallopeptidase [Patescibacteria group bacterium]MBU4512802.1 M48 family metallopeptidase [Patescibacteria group bacterium]MCG2688069.1 M48 family metallopeptidase [Candidatus Parcubacteria bacterium]
MEQKEIKIDKLIRSKRKTIALLVSVDAMLVVRAPMTTSLEYIKDLVFKKRFWINEKKKQVLKNGDPTKNKEFVNGEEFLYLGETYRLKIENCEAVRLTDYLYFPEKYLNDGRAKMIEWYKQKALEKITERADWYSQIIGWKFKSISITKAEKQWGSCGPNGSINFSWKLMMAPLNVIDYVVVHELTHISEKNHSAKFWNKVKTILPDYESRQRWLKDNRMNFKI